MNLESIAGLADACNWIDRLAGLWGALTNWETGIRHKRHKWRGVRTIRVPRAAGISGQQIQDHLEERGVKLKGNCRVNGQDIIFNVGQQAGTWPDYLIGKLLTGAPHTNTWARQGKHDKAKRRR